METNFSVKVIPLGRYSPCVNGVCEFEGVSGLKNNLGQQESFLQFLVEAEWW